MSTPLPYSGVWHSWIFISEPITGILLSPFTGFFHAYWGYDWSLHQLY
jgi:hypothetical protein